MQIPPLPFTVTDWSAVAPTVHPGETGEAIWRTFTIGDLRVGLIELVKILPHGREQRLHVRQPRRRHHQAPEQVLSF